MLGVLNNKRVFQSNQILKYSLESTYKSIDERIDREKKKKLNFKNNCQKVIPIKNKIINIITLFSITSFFFYFINKNK
jgi:hypothetical protein